MKNIAIESYVLWTKHEAKIKAERARWHGRVPSQICSVYFAIWYFSIPNTDLSFKVGNDKSKELTLYLLFMVVCLIWEEKNRGQTSCSNATCIWLLRTAHFLTNLSPMFQLSTSLQNLISTFQCCSRTGTTEFCHHRCCCFSGKDAPRVKAVFKTDREQSSFVAAIFLEAPGCLLARDTTLSCRRQSSQQQIISQSKHFTSKFTRSELRVVTLPGGGCNEETWEPEVRKVQIRPVFFSPANRDCTSLQCKMFRSYVENTLSAGAPL